MANLMSGADYGAMGAKVASEGLQRARKSGLREELELLNNCLSVAESNADALANMLDPILLPSHPTTAGTDRNQVETSASQTTSGLRILRMRISELSNRLETLGRRIDL